MKDSTASPALSADTISETRAKPIRARDISTILQAEIETGILAPGTPLDERVLAARFNVSRTPVREALQQLAAHHFVQIEPHVGAQVTRLTVVELRAMLEFIAGMEVMCAELAARRVDLELRNALDEALARCEAEAREGANYPAANQAFHETIYEGARNIFIARQIRSMRSLLRRYRSTDLQTQAHIDRSLREHKAIAQAIRNGDEAEAARLMREHLPAATTGFAELLARTPSHYFKNES